MPVTYCYDAALDDDPELVDAVRSAVTTALETEHLRTESRARLAEAAGLPPAHRRRGRCRAAATRAQPPRRRPAASGRAGDAAATHPVRHPARPVGGGGADHQRERRAGALARRAARARARHPPRGARARAADRARIAGRPLHGAHGGVLRDLRAPSEAVELAAYFVACEALANVGKYATATSASMHLWKTEQGVAIEIADDGVGGADPAGGSGLRGLADRVEALGGPRAGHEPSGRRDRCHRGAALRAVTPAA